jgi:hypothetical protein
MIFGTPTSQTRCARYTSVGYSYCFVVANIGEPKLYEVLYRTHCKVPYDVSTCNVRKTAWLRILLDELLILHLVKSFPVLFGTHRFITVLLC